MNRLSITCLALMTVSLSADAVTAYSVADDNIQMTDHLVEINLETGDYVSKGKVSDPFIAIEGLAMSPSGELFGADDNTKTLVHINTGQAVALAVSNVNHNMGFGAVQDSYDFGMTFACDNNLYAVVKHTNELYTINENSGAAALVGNTGHNFTSLAAWGDELFAVASADHNLYKINKETAEATLVGDMGDLGGDVDLAGSGMAFDETGQLWMVINLRLSDPLNPDPSRIFKINTETGAADYIADTLVGIESLAIAPPGGCDLFGPQQPAPVPNNSFWALLLLISGVTATAGIYRRSL